ncbi:hypothetical protein Bbelb_340910 [Branchiostoma belcheri]|nr:hypothetical protein Bbelb_340910 [Branchiostoma belcheri]
MTSDNVDSPFPSDCQHICVCNFFSHRIVQVASTTLKPFPLTPPLKAVCTLHNLPARSIDKSGQSAPCTTFPPGVSTSPGEKFASSRLTDRKVARGDPRCLIEARLARGVRDHQTVLFPAGAICPVSVTAISQGHMDACYTPVALFISDWPVSRQISTPDKYWHPDTA